MSRWTRSEEVRPPRCEPMGIRGIPSPTPPPAPAAAAPPSGHPKPPSTHSSASGSTTRRFSTTSWPPPRWPGFRCGLARRRS
jgi:hypothetical protein